MTTEERLQKAQARYDRAARLRYELLGWGTSAKVAEAAKRVENAEKELERAKKAHEKATFGEAGHK